MLGSWFAQVTTCIMREANGKNLYMKWGRFQKNLYRIVMNELGGCRPKIFVVQNSFPMCFFK